jgi:hypothetical protein
MARSDQPENTITPSADLPKGMPLALIGLARLLARQAAQDYLNATHPVSSANNDNDTETP